MALLFVVSCDGISNQTTANLQTSPLFFGGFYPDKVKILELWVSQMSPDDSSCVE